MGLGSENEDVPLSELTKFRPEGYNDAGFAVAFVAQIVCVGAWVGFSAASGRYRAAGHTAMLLQGKTHAQPELSPAEAGKAVVTLAFGSLLMSVLWACIWMALLHSFPVQMVTAALYFLPAVCFCIAILCIVYGALLPCLIFAVIGALVLVWIYFVQDRIEFTARLFKGVSGIYQKSSGIFGTTALVIGLQALWMVLWMFAVFAVYLPSSAQHHSTALVGISSDIEKALGSSSAAPGFGYFLLLISFYWGVQTLSNILHVTCGGVVARHYFNDNVEEAVKDSTTQAFTNYLGSIAFGSLLIAIVQAMKEIARMAQQDAEESGDLVGCVLAAVVGCFLSCVESLIEFFNTFAFCIVAIYGVPFMRAASSAWHLVVDTSAGIEALMTYNLAGMVSFFGTLAGSFLVAGVTALMAWRLGLPPGFVLAGAILGFLVALAIMSVVSRVIESGCVTLFMCFALEPLKMGNMSPELAQTFNEKKAFALS